MARQRIHNRRAAQANNSGASWISYSDMMAALLLVFVLILSISLYNYFTMLESTAAELERKQGELDNQRIIILNQQTQLDEQTLQLASQKVTMDQQNAQIIIIQGQLDAQQAELDAHELVLNAKQDELDNALILLGEKEAELLASQKDLDAALVLLAARENQLNNTLAALDAKTNQIEDMVGVKSQIILDLTSNLNRNHLSATVDQTTGDIVLDSAVLFKKNSSEIQAEGKRLLNQFIPVYLQVLLREEYADYLGQIVIEGHTDDSGSYELNMELSQERAFNVLMYVLNMYPEGSRERTKLEKLLTSTGRSESDLIYYPGTNVVDAEGSRRVEFKFSLKDAEMIEEMNRLLSGD